jgi:hypothetical protein
MPRNPPWDRDELILTLDLYLREGMLDDRDAPVVELSDLLNRLALHPSRPDPGRFRNPNGVAMKLANFAAIDPTHHGTALSRYGRRDREVWDEFAGDRERLARAAATIRQSTSPDGTAVSEGFSTADRMAQVRNVLRNITAQHVEQAIRDIDAEVEHSYGAPTGYELLHNGKRYPPKAVVGLAASRLLGWSVLPQDFSSGKAGSQAVGILEMLGFTVVEKAEEARERRYWAFCANPKMYRVEEAVQERETDTWTTKGKPVREGDRALIWKGKGRDDERGVVALAEVLTDPEPLSGANNPYWVTAPGEDQLEERVRIRYIKPGGLPIWCTESRGGFLNDLSVSRARGGTVFAVTPEQWEALVQVAGGWPEDAPEVQDARDAVAERAGRRGSRQGFRLTPELRRAVELHAMQRARLFYEEEGWHVEDVSASQSYDLRCTRAGNEELHVEVKGTVSRGAEVLLTPNEVEHARAAYPNVALFIVANIQVADPQAVVSEVHGGEVKVVSPWRIADGCLMPVGFSYVVPPPGGV